MFSQDKDLRKNLLYDEAADTGTAQSSQILKIQHFNKLTNSMKVI